MKPFFIGITGGSGSGKTAIANNLKKYLGKKTSVFNMDNYQKFEGKLPKRYGRKNWDHPKAIYWQKLIKDLSSLKKDKEIIIKSREQERLKKVKTLKFKPAKVIIIEGYLLFYNPPVRNLLDFLVYLEANDKTRIKRRTKFKSLNYVKKILLPMHRKYIEPTKKFADLVIDTDKNSVKQSCKKIIQNLPYPLKIN